MNHDSDSTQTDICCPQQRHTTRGRVSGRGIGCPRSIYSGDRLLLQLLRHGRHRYGSGRSPNPTLFSSGVLFALFCRNIRTHVVNVQFLLLVVISNKNAPRDKTVSFFVSETSCLFLKELHLVTMLRDQPWCGNSSCSICRA